MPSHPLAAPGNEHTYTSLDMPTLPPPRASSRAPSPGQLSPLLIGSRSASPAPGDPFYDGTSSASHSSAARGAGSSGAQHGAYDGDLRLAIQTGAVGGAYGPYSPTSPSQSRYTPRVSPHPSPFATSAWARSHDSIASSSAPSSPTIRSDHARQHAQATAALAAASTAPQLTSPNIRKYTAADAALDEKLHTPFSATNRDRSSWRFSFAGFLNILALAVIISALIVMFAGYPVIQWANAHKAKTYSAYNIGGTNASGQVPDIPGLPTLIDKDTPEDALTKTGFDGKKYVLQFSDEFNTDGRTFWPGDDPYWEAVDLHYWPTGDYEWYDPDAITTEDGSLKITLTEEPWNGMNFRSGMLQSWNKMCFSGGGIVEVSISLPGAHDVTGLWPGAWTMGNLGRAGHGATSDGTWPYSYSTCDIGTLPNQTWVNGTGPAAALKSGDKSVKNVLSYQPGQRLSACTCPGAGKEHPGPNVGVGRGAPEIDIIEAQMSYDAETYVLSGSVSQSAQFAPYDSGYETRNTTPYTVVYTDATELNSYLGGIYQEAVSAVTATNPKAYELSGGEFATYSYEYDADETNGYVTWGSQGKADWTMTAAAVGPNAKTQVGQRLITQEPMYIILNLGISDSFQRIDYSGLTFPAHMLIDYVRVYQQEGKESITCDPDSHPTAQYIEDHLNAYSNANLTTWAQAGYDYPKNSMQGC